MLFVFCLSVCLSDLANSKTSICWFWNLPYIFYQTLAKIHIFQRHCHCLLHKYFRIQYYNTRNHTPVSNNCIGKRLSKHIARNNENFFRLFCQSTWWSQSVIWDQWIVNFPESTNTQYHPLAFGFQNKNTLGLSLMLWSKSDPRKKLQFWSETLKSRLTTERLTTFSDVHWMLRQSIAQSTRLFDEALTSKRHFCHFDFQKKNTCAQK